jgi:hypothetical protein
MGGYRGLKQRERLGLWVKRIFGLGLWLGLRGIRWLGLGLRLWLRGIRWRWFGLGRWFGFQFNHGRLNSTILYLLELRERRFGFLTRLLKRLQGGKLLRGRWGRWSERSKRPKGWKRLGLRSWRGKRLRLRLRSWRGKRLRLRSGSIRRLGRRSNKSLPCDRHAAIGARICPRRDNLSTFWAREG